MEEVDPPPQTPVPNPWRLKPEFGKSGFTGAVSGLVRPGKRRLAPTDINRDDDPREFKRVRMVSKIRQIKQRHFSSIRANGSLKTMIPGDITAKPEGSKEAFLDLVEVRRRDLEIARQMGLLGVLKVKPDLRLPVPHSEPVNNRIFYTSTHTNDPASTPHGTISTPA